MNIYENLSSSSERERERGLYKIALCLLFKLCAASDSRTRVLYGDVDRKDRPCRSDGLHQDDDVIMTNPARGAQTWKLRSA